MFMRQLLIRIAVEVKCIDIKNIYGLCCFLYSKNKTGHHHQVISNFIFLSHVITLYWPFLTFCPSKKHQYLFIKALSHIQIICMHKLMWFYTTQQIQPKTEHHIMFVMPLILLTYMSPYAPLDS